MNPLYVEGVGVAAPGLDDWTEAASVLRGDHPYQKRELSNPAPQLLPPNERRRATLAVRLAFRAAEQAAAQCAAAPADLASVFASSDADTAILNRLCTALALPERRVSPTDFHNSVHNAAAGYWSIAAGSVHPSVSLSAGDHSFAMGLLEAAALALSDGLKVLLVAYDVRPPEPLHAARRIEGPAGIALVLAPRASPQTLAQLHVTLREGEPSSLPDPGLEKLRRSNPAAQALPLLNLIARREAGEILLSAAGPDRVCVGVRF